MTEQVFEFLTRTDVLVVGLGLVAFLTLYWALRGAPLGQAAAGEEDDEAPRSGYRDRIVAAAVVGLLLVVVGAVVAAGRSIPWSLPLFAAGFGTILSLIRINRRYRHASPTLRRVVQVCDTALTGSLLAGVLIVGNVVAFKYGGRPLDFTRERAYSLSSQTVNLLRGLDRPVTFTIFSGNREAVIRTRQLLELYQAQNPERVRLELVDRSDPERWRELVEAVPDVAVTIGGGLVVTYGEGDTAERLVVRNTEIFDVARPSPYDGDALRFESVFRGEDALTSALSRLQQGRKPRIAFTTGHGEPALERMDRDREGLGLLHSRLMNVGTEAVEINLLSDAITPEDTALVVIVAPRSAFQSRELETLQHYMDRGGRLLLIVGFEVASGLEEWLAATFRVRIGSKLVVDPIYNFDGRANVVAVPIPSDARHPVVETLAGLAVVLPSAVPLEIERAAEPNPNIITTVLLRTSRESWAESDPRASALERDEDRDDPGPLAVAIAAAEPPPPGAPINDVTPRLVVLSGRYLADNLFVQANPTNLDLVVNAIQWLRGSPELLGIPPKTHVALTLVADPNLFARLVFVPTLMAITLIIGLGVATFLARRQ